jgi:TRAP-type C4-dicarboxylate transport system permease small subunit
MLKLVHILKQLNEWVARLAGLALLAGIALIIIEIVLREMGFNFSGSEEISGYLMASLSSWGISYALMHRAHVRIDILREKAQKHAAIRSLFDLVAIASVSFVAIYVATKVVAVVEKSANTGALANTALETPLIIPQSIWLAGWLWFAVLSTLLLLIGVVLFAQRRFDDVDSLLGIEESH